MIAAPRFRAGLLGQSRTSAAAQAPGAPLAAAFIQRLITAGVTPNGAQRRAIEVITDAIAAIGPTKFLAVYPFIGGTAACHALNLVSTSYGMTWNGTVTHNASGITGNGTTGYGTTGLIPTSTTMTNASAHIMAYVTTPAAGATQCMIGCQSSADNNLRLFCPYTGADATYFWYPHTGASGAVSYPSLPVTGCVLGNLVAGPLARQHRNGYRLVNATTGAAPDTTLPNVAVFVAANNNAGTPGSYSGHTIACASIGLGLSDAEALGWYRAVDLAQQILARGNRWQLDLSEAYLDRLYAAGLTAPTAVQRTALEQLSEGISKIGRGKFLVVYPFIGASAATHALNLMSSSYGITWAGGLTHDANGVAPNGTTGEGNCNFADALRPANFSFSLYVRTVPAVGLLYFGWAQYASTTCYGIGAWTNSAASWAGRWDYAGDPPGADTATGSVTPATRLISSTRKAIDDHRLYRDGGLVTTNVVPQVQAASGWPCYFFRDGPASYHGAGGYCFAHIGEALSAAEHVTLAAAVQAAQTTLSRNV